MGKMQESGFRYSLVEDIVARTSCVREISEDGSSTSWEGSDPCRVVFLLFGGVIPRYSKPSVYSASSMSKSNLNMAAVNKIILKS